MKIHVFYQVIVFAITLFIMAEQEPDLSTCIDWSKCVLCQEATTEALQSPNNSTRSDIDPGAGYHTLANNILRFNEINSLPDTIDLFIYLFIYKLRQGQFGRRNLTELLFQ